MLQKNVWRPLLWVLDPSTTTDAVKFDAWHCRESVSTVVVVPSGAKRSLCCNGS